MSTALSQSGVVANNALTATQLPAGQESFSVPFWTDLSDTEADIEWPEHIRIQQFQR